MKRASLIAVIAVAAAAATGSVAASHAASARVPAACPGHAPPKLITSKATARGFVRPGATAMRICRYYGINWGDSQALQQQRLISGAVTIGRITRTFNGLHEPRRGIFCVRDDGTELLVVFGYPNGHAERVVVKLSGCRFALNGRATRWTTPRLQRRLLNLVKGR